MSSVSTFGTFTSARLGMYASMKGLEVTGHNIANINTKGYTRQSLDQYALKISGSDRNASIYNDRVGSGVLCTGISQLRDPYLDIRFRNEQASVGSMDAKLAVLEDMSSILDEVGKGADGDGVLEAQFNDLMEQLNNLMDKPGSDELDGLVRSSASTLVTLFNSYSEKLSNIAEQQRTDYNQDIDSVNGILENIRNLNESIRKSDIHGDAALELRDQRNMLLDQLSGYMKIDVTYSTEAIGAGSTIQKMTVSLAGTKPPVNLVDGIYGGQISINQTLRVSADGNHYEDADGNPTDAAGAERLTDPTLNLQLSKLKSRFGEEQDATAQPVTLGNTQGSLEASRKMMVDAGEFTVVNGAAAPTTSRGIPYYLNALDGLANQFAKAMNDANRPYQVDAEGNYLDNDGNPIERGTAGSGQFLNKNTITAAEKENLDVWGAVRLGGDLFSNGTDSAGGPVQPGKITASNITISNAWTKGETKIQISDQKDSLSPVNIAHIKYVLTNGSFAFKPSDVVDDASDTPFFTGTFQKMYAGVCSTLANDRLTTSTMLQNYATSATSLDIGRDSVSSVDLNDEAANMMQYQKSYSAACRLMTTIDEALDKLINGTGVVGR